MAGSFAEGLVGIVLDGRYRLDALLGEGGMGSVYRAQHLAMDRRVAVKLLKPHLTQNADGVERFMREARATLKVDSPHAVKVLDFGITPHGDYYMALEYLDGRTVQRELDVDGPFSPLRTLHIARHALHALANAHESGLVHRDIKPDNILLMRVGDDPDYTKLLDFGVAKLMEGAAVSDKSRLALTAAGMVFGTPEFMSPEQACGHPLDGRSDLYSLAATMFAMLTGCGLFEGRTAIEWLTHHARTPPPHLAMVASELAQYPELDALLQRCLAKRREDRPASARELDQQLAKLEVYVQRGGTLAAARSSSRLARQPTDLSASAYFTALPAELVQVGATILPSPPRTSEPRLDAPPASLPADSTEIPLVPAGSRRGLVLGVGGVLALAIVGVAIGVAARARSHAAPADATGEVAGRDASALAIGDAAPVGAPPDAPLDTPVADAAIARISTDAGVRTPPKSPAALEHLRAAEQALRDGNRLRQLAEADLALKAEPRNARAKYLLADALIKGGDLERGCAYLRALGRNQIALARASSAKCP